VSNPKIDVLTLYTVYARAVPDPYTHISRLQIALNYSALGVKDGRVLGGGNLDVNTNGIVVTGCAAGLNGYAPDPHCVQEFVAHHAERLARDAGNKLALQLSALLGRAYGTPPVAGLPGGARPLPHAGKKGAPQINSRIAHGGGKTYEVASVTPAVTLCQPI